MKEFAAEAFPYQLFETEEMAAARWVGAAFASATCIAVGAVVDFAVAFGPELPSDLAHRPPGSNCTVEHRQWKRLQTTLRLRSPDTPTAHTIHGWQTSKPLRDALRLSLPL